MPYIPDDILLLSTVMQLLFWLSVSLMAVGVFTQERGHWWIMLVSVAASSIASAAYGYLTQFVEYHCLGMVGLVAAVVLGSALWFGDEKNIPPPHLRY